MATANVMKSSSSETGFRLKGWHVLVIALGFFGSVITVDVVMAILAVKTFSGVEAEKPYESGLAFNKEIAAANAQNARGWTVTQHIARDADGTVTLTANFKDKTALAIGGLDVTMNLKAPADAKRDLSVLLQDRGAGVYNGMVEATAGQWDVEIIAKQNDDIVYRSVNRVILK